jgi:ribosome-associated protein
MNRLPARSPKPQPKSPARAARAAEPPKPQPDKSQPDKPQPDKYRLDAIAAAAAAIDKKGIEPVLIDLSAAQSYTDYLLVTSAHSSRGVRAIAEHIEKVLTERGVRALGSEGVREGHWALLDFGDLVVHVFEQNLREFYDLEGMWFDAPRIELDIPPELRLVAQASRYGDDLHGEEHEQPVAGTIEY